MFTDSYRVMTQLCPVLFSIQKSRRSQPKCVHIDKLEPFRSEPTVVRDLDPNDTEVNRHENMDGQEAELPPLTNAAATGHESGLEMTCDGEVRRGFRL